LSLFASAGVIGGLSGIAARGHRLPEGAPLCFGAALILLALGALGGLFVALPRDALVVDTEPLRQTIDDPTLWAAPTEEHLRRSYGAILTMIDSSRAVNREKAKWLRRAMYTSGGGIMLILAAVVIVLVRR
jgi:hypothetical protein